MSVLLTRKAFITSAGSGSDVWGGALTSADIVAYGDSLTRGDGTVNFAKTPANAAAIRLKTTVLPKNRGIGGQVTEQIGARLGCFPVTVTISGNSIPASGGVAVTDKNINVLFDAGVYTGTILGSIAGVPGTMSTDGAGAWTFTRTDSGDATAVAPGTQFILDEAVAFRGYTHWLNPGRNDVPDTATILAGVAAMVSYLGHTRYRVLSVLSSTLDGTPVLDAIDATNAALASIYGPRYVDSRAALFAANDGSANDLADIAARFTPRSLRSDNLHLTDAGYEIVGIAIAQSYLVADQNFTPDLGLAAAWGEFDSASGWTFGAGWAVSGGKMIGTALSGQEVMRSVPEITIGQPYRAIVRGYYDGLNVRNGGQYLTIGPAGNGSMTIDFTATAQDFGFQTAGSPELLNVALLAL